MMINSFLEALSIGILLPLFSLILNNSENNFISEHIFKIFSQYNFEPTIEFFLIMIITIFLLKYIFTIYFTKIQTSFLLNLKANLSTKIFEDYLYKSLQFHSNTSSSTMVRNINNEVGKYLNSYLSPILAYLLATFTISFIVLLLLIVNIESTLILILIFGIIHFIIIKAFSKYLKKIGELRQIHDKFSLRYIYEAVRTIIEVNLLGLQTYYKNKFYYHVDKIAIQGTMRSIIGIIPKIIFELTLLLLICYFIFYYSSNNLPLENLMEQLLIYATAAFRIMPSLNSITKSHQKIKFGLPSAELLASIFSNFSKKEIKNEFQKKTTPISFERIIKFENINFSYDEKNIIFKNFNFEIKKNETVGIIGKNGSGKSTLVKLFCGLLESGNGIVKVDDKIIDISSNEWKKLIGYIPQEINLIEGSILENICLGIKSSDCDQKKISKIIEIVELEDFIKSLSEGVQTEVGELGSRLSGGQKQKIGIARALYRNPEILIFDESTSSLDEISEQKFIENLNHKFTGKTKLIISHRPTALKYCNKVLKISLNNKE
jgi:ATP-binding cassette, subfamily B, bacterial PglK